MVKQPTKKSKMFKMYQSRKVISFSFNLLLPAVANAQLGSAVRHRDGLSRPPLTGPIYPIYPIYPMYPIYPIYPIYPTYPIYPIYPIYP